MKSRILVPQQVPEFVRAEYPAFLEFLKAYYQWLEEEYSPGRLEELVDIDETINEFLVYFRKQLDIYGITANTDDRTFLRNIKELYTAKGSDASFEFLFKVLFNKSSRVIQPWDYVFIPSNGNWRQDTSVIVQADKGDPTNLVGNFIVITDSTGRRYRTYAINSVQRRDGFTEVFVKRFRPQAPLVTASLADGSVSANILNTTVKATIEKPGTGFRPGQLFYIDSYGGTGTLCKVKSTSTDGGITAIEIITFGTGYQTTFNALITPTDQIDPTKLGARIQLGGLNYATNDDVNPQKHEGSIVRHNYSVTNPPYMEDLTYVGDTVGELRSQAGVRILPGDDYASIKFIVGQYCVYPGYYEDSKNILGDLVYIQDSYCYQIYSYVTALDQSLDTYRDILRQVLHPTGTKHFASYEITNNFAIDPSISVSLNLIAKKDIIRDVIRTVDQLIFAIETNLADEYTATDQFNRIVSYIRSFESGIEGVTDEVAKNIQPVYTDAVELDDEYSRIVDYNRILTSTATTFDGSLTWDVNRVLADIALIVDNIQISGDFGTLLSTNTSAFDSISFTSSRAPLETSVTVVDDIDVLLAFPVASLVLITDGGVTITNAKYNSETIQTANSGGLYNESYVEQLPPYWEAGYLENEQQITN